jgi:prevent-host-death family protein
MAKVSIRELKPNLSALIERVEAGETIIVAKRNEPVAEIRPIARRSAMPMLGNPVIGLRVGSEFFDPLPEELLAAFNGEARR